MTPFDRQVRAQIYRHIIASGSGPTARQLADQRGWPPEEVEEAMRRLEIGHLIALMPDRVSVRMAHPFSGIETLYRSQVDNKSWFANCAWDALAILAMMGDGLATQGRGDETLIWTVNDGLVSPGGVIHMTVPPRHFWDDIVFT